MIQLCLMCSCIKEEIPISKKNRGNINVQTVEMGPTYDLRYYINMSGTRNDSVNKYDWDIALSGDSLMPFIKLNTAVGMSVYKTDKTSLSELQDTIGYMHKELIDYPCGDADSLGLSDIFSSKSVYIIDLGTDAFIQAKGFVFLKAEIVNNQYLLTYRFYNKQNIITKNISFNPNKIHQLYQFQSQLLRDEPDISNWDFMITQYQHIYYDPFQKYSVVGCLINPKKVLAYTYSGSKTFENLSFSDVILSNFSAKEDIIGFSWKYYDLNKNEYIIRPQKCYIIKYNDGRLFKLHFIGFYNSKGEKGSPIFEYKEL